ncbi:MAG: hypothetical protein D6805_03065 [Planctomycetota bacterium]|nr:MAG: hypothetical protein D6805_03065 [Planctomycetota bacterium]
MGKIYCKRGLLLSLLSLALLLPQISDAARLQEGNDLKKGDKFYQEKSYKKAYQFYQKHLQAFPNHKRNGEIKLRITKCLWRLREYDKATNLGLQYLAKMQKNIWKARLWKTLAYIKIKKPHYGYKKNGKITWGRYVQGGRYIYSYREDYSKAVEYFQKARIVYLTLAGREKSPASDLIREWVEVDFALSTVLEKLSGYYPRKPIKLDFITKFPKEYSPKLALEKRVLFLLIEAETQAKQAKLLEQAAQARYLRAMYLHRTAPNFRQTWPKLPKFLDTLYHLDELIRNYPKAKVLPQAYIAAGLIQQRKYQFLKAKVYFQNLLKNFPHSKWASDARFYISAMEREYLNFPNLPQSLPGQKVQINISTRNIPQLNLQLSKFRLHEFLNSSGQKSYQAVLGNLSYHHPFMFLKYAEPPFRSWKVKLPDKKDHRWCSQKLTLPSLETGAYLLEAKTQQLAVYKLWIVSDLGLIQKNGKKKILVYVVNRISGEPVPGAKVLFKEKYSAYHPLLRRYLRHSKVHTQTTDKDGIALQNRQSSNYSRIEVAAWIGNRYAISPYGSFYQYSSSSGQEYRFYVMTDRPIYRPAQKVNFRVWLRRYKDGHYLNAPHQKVRVLIHSPRGKKVYENILMTNANGGFAGSFTLSKKAALGTYFIYFRLSNGAYGYARGNRFRVEEYKKPEFEVEVLAPQEQVRLGNKIQATIRAKYYFGAPVTKAKVFYTVRRYYYQHSYYPSTPWDWLYGQGYWMSSYRKWSYRYHRYYRPYDAGEVILQGTGKTNEKGEFSLQWATDSLLKKRGKWDHRFVIQARVVDESRRQIQGMGEVKVTRNSFYAYLFAKRGFYTPGDKGEFSLHTMTASYQPVESQGILKIYEVRYHGAKSEKETLTLVRTFPLTTSKQGKAEFSFSSPKAGRFRLVFETKDKWQQPLTVSKDIWFVNSQFSGTYYRFGQLEILTDKRYYKKGEVAHVMVNVARPGAAVLLTEEFSSQISQYQVLRIPGKSTVFSLPITQRHVPNFFLVGETLYNNKIYRQIRQVFVPPQDKILRIQLRTHQPTYSPGQKVRLNLEVYDSQNRPVSTEVSLAVVDKSIFYFQSEYAPNVKKFFYGSLRAQGTSANHSLNFQSQGVLKDYQPSLGYPKHGLPPGFYEGGFANFEGAKINAAQKLMPPRGLLRLGRTKSAPSAPLKELGKRAELKGKGFAKDAVAAKKTPRPRSLVKPRVRKNFADTAYWNPFVLTDSSGKASVEFTLPDSLTTWKIHAKAITSQTQVGQKTIERISRKNLILRLQAPRFFTERDEVVLSGVVHNYLPQTKEILCKILLNGASVQLLQNAEQRITLPPKGHQRVDWRVRILAPGKLSIQMAALSDTESDAQQLSFPVYVHGISKQIAKGGELSPKETLAKVEIHLPQAIRKDSARLEIVLSPSLASAMLDALPYLSAYPYGCVEQTMSRFLPSVITAATLKELGMNLEFLAEKRKELYTRYLASGLWRYPRSKIPALKTEELNKRVQAGLKRLYNFQHSDGGWGWWKYGRSDIYMSSYVTFGLYTALKAGYSVNKAVLTRATRYLKRSLPHIQHIHRLAYTLWVLSHIEKANLKDLELVYQRRDELNLLSKALLALTLHNMGQQQKAQVLCRNLEDFAKEDKSGRIAWFETEQNGWWYWWNDDIETNAFILKAFSQIQPKHHLLPKMVRWLLQNRIGGQWKSTKATAYVVYAFSDYLKATKELNANYTLNIQLGGKRIKTIQVTPQNALFFENRILLKGAEITTGKQLLTIEKQGQGRLYYSVFLEYFTKEENLQGSGHEILVKREYFKLIPELKTKKVDGRTVRFQVYQRQKLTSGATLKSGDLVEVRLTIQSKNNYEYLVFEDRKPAGMEAVALRSGYTYANGLCSNMELRDEKVVFFVSWLQQGTHTISYKLRAEIPGAFHALPTYAEAMYAPKVKSISDEWRVQIRD